MRAWLNGEEVSDRCFYADTRRGIVRLYRLNSEGRKYIEYMKGHPLLGRPAIEERHGRVRIERAAT